MDLKDSRKIIEDKGGFLILFEIFYFTEIGPTKIKEMRKNCIISNWQDIL
jgi:hypothetical protein